MMERRDFYEEPDSVGSLQNSEEMGSMGRASYNAA
jgi:hypothetical protein